ncbi:MAG: hypothetical protein COB84_01960 [Rhodobacteraceae bacterium]|nr:MAG: hypothetical protein COB84_01960 [Paracoccaceae bacterium]
MAAALPLILAGGSTLLSASQQASAGQIAQLESNVKSKQIETAAAQREADRKAGLAEAAASQVSAAGASGIQFEGSPLSILEEDIRKEEQASQRDIFQARIGAQAEQARGSVARRIATGKALTGLLQSGQKFAGIV